MVMDATPSPQSVGREFVRQYYTLLNKAPNHLHRFYNNSSSFVHAGLDLPNREATVVIGQKQIHSKIQQLNFHDCHAKISQVDSQATLGSGVVVQVTGELSNDGQPMRRFTQTFVLAAQSPKKYYVHNDIFRYQDVYGDEEAEVESSRSENDEEVESESLDNTSTLAQAPATIFYPIPPAGQNVTIQPFVQQPQMNGVIHEEIIQTLPVQNLQQQTIPQQQQQQLPIPVPIIPIEPNLVPIITAPVPILTPIVPSTIDINEPVIIETTLKINENSPIELAPEIIENEQQQQIEIITKQIEKIDLTPKEEIKPVSNEPKTYANLFKSQTGLSFVSTPQYVSSASQRQNTVSPPPQSKYQQDERRSESGGPSGSLPQRSNARPMPRERRSSNTNNSQNFGDNHQLFLGNIPHAATEDELKTLFSKFGTVVDLRVHSKPGAPKMPGARAPPNYGFITYEDPESVQNCLENQPLFYPENSSDGQKLNVEEKKTRSRGPNDMGNNRSDNSDRMRNISGSGGAQRSMGGNSSSRGGQNSGMSRGISGGRGGNGGGGGGRGGFNRTDSDRRGGSSATRNNNGGGQSGGGSGGGGSGGNTGNTSGGNYGRR